MWKRSFPLVLRGSNQGSVFGSGPFCVQGLTRVRGTCFTTGMSETLTSAYSGQPIPDPGMPSAGDVWIDRSGGGIRRVMSVEGGIVYYTYGPTHGPRTAIGVEQLRRTAVKR